MIRFGILGTTYTAEFVDSIRAIPHIQLVGIAGDKSQGSRTLPAPEDLLAQDLHAAVICSSATERPDLIQLAAGKVSHILCDAPFAFDLEGARAVLATCEAHACLLQPAFSWRFAPTLISMKQALDQGKLGRPFGLRVIYRSKLSNKAPASGAIMLSRTLHVIDLLRWLLNTDVVEIQAEVGTSLIHPGLDDVHLLSCALTNGAYATLDCSLSLPDSYPSGEDLTLHMVGELGTLRADAFRQSVDVSSTAKVRIYWGSHHWTQMIRDFTDCIAAKRHLSISPADALRAHEIAQAAFQAASRQIRI